ncbi:MAG: hypothetical protein FWF81_13520 [Defluviitaleaceae bacterium]|nr:hypothetical protein [Defluviitaleaceae bacterium]
MKGKTYDLEKLSASGNFDVSVITRFYYNTQEYFDALTTFVNTYSRDLGNYTPAFVVNSDADREEFMKECFEIRADYVRLGLNALIESLVVMEDAAINRDVKEFSDGQISYQATLKICKDDIKNATTRWKMKR